MADIVRFGEHTIEIVGDENLSIAALRAFAGMTLLDAEVDKRSVPTRPVLTNLAIRLLRWYRCAVSPRLGQRCVLDPSCSRYAEIAISERGLAVGAWMTTRRLCRCRPGAGGVDLP